MSPFTGPEKSKQRENKQQFGSKNAFEGVPAKIN